MKITIITQNEPFFLGENINWLIKNLPNSYKIVSCVLLSPSPFGKKEGMSKKIKKTINTFGLFFFINYLFLYIINFFNPYKNVKKVLQKKHIPIIRLQKNINNPESLKIIKKFQPDILISIAGNQIFKSELINLAPLGCLNLHTALLPKYRGLMPTFWVLLNNEEFTGVSVFFVDKGIDSGPILVQKKIAIKKYSQRELIRITKKIGMEAIIEALQLIEKGEYKLIENSQEEMSYFSFPTKENVKAFIKCGKKFF